MDPKQPSRQRYHFCTVAGSSIYINTLIVSAASAWMGVISVIWLCPWDTARLLAPRRDTAFLLQARPGMGELHRRLLEAALYSLAPIFPQCTLLNCWHHREKAELKPSLLATQPDPAPEGLLGTHPAPSGTPRKGQGGTRTSGLDWLVQETMCNSLNWHTGTFQSSCAFGFL